MQISEQSINAYIVCKVAKNLFQSALGKRYIIIKVKITLYVLKSNNFLCIINSAPKKALQSVMVADIPKALLTWIILKHFHCSVETNGTV